MGGKPRFGSFLVMNLSSVVEGGHALLKRGLGQLAARALTFR
jgi:hypothetical protein